MQRFQLAAATRSWPLPLDDALRAAVSIGVSGVQLDVRDELPVGSLTETGRRDFLHIMKELGLRIGSTVFPLRHPLASEHQLDRRLAALRAAMQFSFQLGATTLCVRAGRLPDDRSSPEGKLLQEVLSDLARYGNHVGVSLAITPTADGPDRLRDWVEGIITGPIGVDFDPAQFVQSGFSSSDALRTLHGTILHLQLRDGIRDLSGGGEEAPVGQGAVDWIELLALLAEMDYAGWLTAIRNSGDDRPRDVARAIAQVQRWLFLK